MFKVYEKYDEIIFKDYNGKEHKGVIIKTPIFDKKYGKYFVEWYNWPEASKELLAKNRTKIFYNRIAKEFQKVNGTYIYNNMKNIREVDKKMAWRDCKTDI